MLEPGSTLASSDLKSIFYIYLIFFDLLFSALEFILARLKKKKIIEFYISISSKVLGMKPVPSYVGLYVN